MKVKDLLKLIVYDCSFIRIVKGNDENCVELFDGPVKRLYEYKNEINGYETKEHILNYKILNIEQIRNRLVIYVKKDKQWKDLKETKNINKENKTNGK